MIVVRQGLYRGKKKKNPFCSGRGLSLSHIFFIDDCLFISKAIVRNAIYIKTILDAYCSLSRQAVYYHKSFIIFNPSTPLFIKQKIRSLFRVVEQTRVWHYLGLLVFAGPLVPTHFSIIHHKVAHKNCRMEVESLYFAGRLTLLQSVLTSLPFYCMSTIHVPTSLLRNLEKEFRAWGHSVRHKGFILSLGTLFVSQDLWVRWVWPYCIFEGKPSYVSLQLILFFPHTLWAQLASAKYKFKASWIGYTKPHHCSTMWSKICSSSHLIQHQFQRSLASRLSINVYTDPSISNIPLSKLPTYLNIHIHYENLLVSDLITSDKNRDIEKLAMLFPANMMNQIT